MDSLEAHRAKEYFRDSRDIVPPLRFTDEGMTYSYKKTNRSNVSGAKDSPVLRQAYIHKREVGNVDADTVRHSLNLNLSPARKNKVSPG